MQGPARIDFHNMAPSARLIARVERRISRLRRVFGRLIDCRVVIAAPHRHHQSGNLYRVQITLAVPGGDLVISRNPGLDRGHADLGVAIRDAFDAAERRLTEHRGRRSGEGGQHRRQHARAARAAAIDRLMVAV